MEFVTFATIVAGTLIVADDQSAKAKYTPECRAYQHQIARKHAIKRHRLNGRLWGHAINGKQLVLHKDVCS